jgi:methylated-DNA-[protein]-cysteine S-methyltransferase
MMARKSFSERCYAVLRRVPRGKVTTYALLARALGTRAFRAVGQAMHRNPYAPIVPCHRVVKSDGSLGGYALGLKQKIALLKKEGVAVAKGRIVDFDKRLFVPQ